MFFTAEAKLQLQAAIEAIEPTPEVNPLQQALDDAVAMNTALTNQLATANELNAVLQGKISAADSNLTITLAALRA